MGGWGFMKNRDREKFPPAMKNGYGDRRNSKSVGQEVGDYFPPVTLLSLLGHAVKSTHYSIAHWDIHAWPIFDFRAPRRWLEVVI